MKRRNCPYSSKTRHLFETAQVGETGSSTLIERPVPVEALKELACVLGRAAARDWLCSVEISEIEVSTKFSCDPSQTIDTEN